MPTFVTHAAIPLSMRFIFGRELISNRLIAAACLAAILPDIDVIAFYFNIPYAADFGHRGASHSLAFALTLGLLAGCFHDRLCVGRNIAFFTIAVTTVTHGLLDACTNGGLGVAFYWPVTSERFFFPWRPIDVSPISIDAFLSGRASHVIYSEMVWIWIPLALSGFTLRGLRSFVRRR